MPRVLLLAVALLAAGSTAQPPVARPDAARPNVVVVFSDDHAFQGIGAYGGRLAALDPTPRLDRLAREGVLFRNAFVTNSICAPSRAVLLTGRHSHLNGVRTNTDPFDGTQVTFPKLLRSAGYQTALVGKWHLKSTPTGFDHWEIMPGQGIYYNPDFETADGRVRYEGYATDVTTDRAVRWLDEDRDPDRPFLLMVQHKAPHRPWEPGPETLDRFAGPIPEPPTLFDDHRGRTPAACEARMTVARDLYLHYDLKVPGADSSGNAWIDAYPDRFRERLTPSQRATWDAAYGPENEAFLTAGLQGDAATRWRYRRYLRDYLRTTASLDANVGRLLDALDARGLTESTVVVYTSDQGFFLGEHGWFDKRWMYEESFRTPLIVRWPGHAPAGAERRQLVQNLDLAPTFLALAGVAVPEAIQGRSLTPLLTAEPPTSWRDALYYHYYESPSEHVVPRHEGVRTDRYKLVHYYERGEWELFDLARDPDEMRSAYDDPTYDRIRQRLTTALDSLRDVYAVDA